LRGLPIPLDAVQTYWVALATGWHFGLLPTVANACKFQCRCRLPGYRKNPRSGGWRNGFLPTFPPSATAWPGLTSTYWYSSPLGPRSCPNPAAITDGSHEKADPRRSRALSAVLVRRRTGGSPHDRIVHRAGQRLPGAHHFHRRRRHRHAPVGEQDHRPRLRAARRGVRDQAQRERVGYDFGDENPRTFTAAGARVASRNIEDTPAAASASPSTWLPRETPPSI
jgi:hypothetical protein